MKFLKYFLFLIVIIGIGLMIYVAVQPSQYNVKRTQLIKAPTHLVFNNVNDYKNWESWGPWFDDDPTIEVTYPENTSGVGGSYSWTSKDGPGNMKTIKVNTNKLIAQKLQFLDYKPTDTFWQFEETSEGTNVTWQMKANETPFIFKFFGAISGGMDNMLGTMMEKGLAKMDSVMQVEAKAYKEKILNAYKIGDVTEIDLTAQKFIGYLQKTSTNASYEEMTKLFMEYMPKAKNYANSKQLGDTDTTPASVYIKWDENTKQAEFLIGLIVKKDIGLAEGMQAIDLPSGKGIMVSKFGQYGTGDYEAHTAIGNYLKNNNLTQNGHIWETYVNDPTKVKEIEIQTDIYYPVKN